MMHVTLKANLDNVKTRYRYSEITIPAKFISNNVLITIMVLFYESEAQIWEIIFLLMGVIYPVAFFWVIWKADKPKPVDPKEVLENEEKSLA